MRASLIAQLVKNPSAVQETPVWFLGKEDLLERDRLPTPVFLGFPCGSAGKESACNAGDLGSIPGLGRSRGEGNGCPLQYSGRENSMDCIVYGVAKSQRGLSNFHFHFLYQLSHQGSPRILEWVAYPYSTGYSWPRNQTGVSCIAGGLFTNWAIRESLSLSKTH